MTKDEALKLALDALKTLMIERGSIYDKAITAIREALAQPEPNYKKALEVWLDKTEWVQKTVKPHELGMHRADVLKQRIEEALAQPEHDKTDVRCECCGYMTYHREHLGCIRAAKLKEPEQDPLTDEDLELLKRALRFYEGCPDGQYDELVVELIYDRLARRSDIKPLTDEQIGSCIDEVNLTSQYGHHHFGWHKQFAKAIEAAHGIKGEA